MIHFLHISQKSFSTPSFAPPVCINLVWKVVILQSSRLISPRFLLNSVQWCGPILPHIKISFQLAWTCFGATSPVLFSGRLSNLKYTYTESFLGFYFDEAFVPQCCLPAD